MNGKNLLLASLSAVLISCSTGPERDPDAPDLGSYTAEEARAEVQSLMQAIELPEREQTILLGRLDSLLGKAEVIDAGVNGVAVYRYGAGGFMIRAGHGTLMASFKGGGDTVKYSAGGVGLAFTVGGGAQQGVILATGLTKEFDFAGSYSGRGKQATGGSAGVASATATRKDHEHTLHMVATSAGLEATWGAGAVTIQRED